MKFPKLFEACKVGKLELANRIVMPPMTTNFAKKGFVTDVMVDGDTAWFIGECTYDSMHMNEGKWLFVKTMDGGEPGTNGDQVWWKWYPSEKPTWADEGDLVAKTIVSGNLQVHSYDMEM